MADETPPPDPTSASAPKEADADTALPEATMESPDADNPPISQADLDLIEKAMSQVDSAAGDLNDALKAAGSDSAALGQSSIDDLLKQANFDDADAVAAETPASDAEMFKLPNLQQVMADAQVSSIDLLRDVELNVKIELGRSRMLVEDVLKLGEGSVVELDKLAGDPVDVFVNDRLVARGEVLVLNDNFCVRVNEIVAGAKEEAI
jgi:flagellar motor switch protein FliN/FliY